MNRKTAWPKAAWFNNGRRHAERSEAASTAVERDIAATKTEKAAETEPAGAAAPAATEDYTI